MLVCERGRVPGDLGERERSEFLQGEKRGVDHARDQRGKRAVGRDQAGPVVALGGFRLQGRVGLQAEEIVQRHPGRSRADAGDGMDLAVSGPHQQRRLAAEAVVGELRDGAGKDRRDAGVDGVAARMQRAHRGLSDQLRACGDGGLAAADDRTHDVPAQDLALAALLVRTAPSDLRVARARREQPQDQRPGDMPVSHHRQPLSS